MRTRYENRKVVVMLAVVIVRGIGSCSEYYTSIFFTSDRRTTRNSFMHRKMYVWIRRTTGSEVAAGCMNRYGTRQDGRGDCI